MSIERLREAHADALASIVEMVAALDTDDDEARDEALEAIQNDALEVTVRSGWYIPGASDETTGAEEYRILLTTGGPAVQITGDLSEHGEPTTARLEVQDWFEPWTSFPVTEDEAAALMTYAAQFWYGEGA